MKNRLIALLLACMMAVSCAAPAWAEEGAAPPEASMQEQVEVDTAEGEENVPETLPEEEEAVSEETNETNENENEMNQAQEDTEPVENAEEEAALPETPDELTEEAPAQKQVEETEAAESVETADPVEEAVEEELPTEEPAPQSEEEKEEKTVENGEEIIITLGDSPSENFTLLQNAIKRGSVTGKTVRIAEKGTFTIYKSSASTATIHLLPNTTLDLGGATLVRGGIMNNMIIFCDENDERTGTGYEMTGNITVKNGTLDGSGGSGKDVNLVNVGHANNVVFYKVNFKNNKGAHLIEFTGCRDCRVEKCTFTGYTPPDGTEPGEAVQLDISYDGADCSWNGIYVADSTPCKDITITGCTFKNYPCGVGNHHAVKGLHNSGIVITKNTFKNSKSYQFKSGDSANLPAIRCYGFEDSIVSGNTITGKYTSAIEVCGGSVTIEENKIGTEETAFAHPGIAETYGYDWIPGSSSRSDRVKTYVTAGTITDNTIYCSASTPAVTLYNKTKLSALSTNTINTSDSHGIYISKSTVSGLNSNIVTAKGGCGVYVTGSTVSNMKSNTIKKSLDYGIYLTSSSKCSSKLSSNKITTCGKSGIYATSNSKVKTVQSNKVTGCKKYGIAVLNPDITVTVTKNTFSKNKKNLYIKAKGTIQKK